MKNYLGILFCLFSLSAFAIDTSCLTQTSAPISAQTNEIIKIIAPEDIYPIQGDILLPIRETNLTTTPQYFSYSVIESSGLEITDFGWSYIFDNNPLTYIQFGSNPKSITLKFDDPLFAGEFYSYIGLSHTSAVKVQISNDGQMFKTIALGDISLYSFQYLQLSFLDYTKKNDETLFAPTIIRDILFWRKSPKTYVIKSQSDLPIYIYSLLGCDDKELSKTLIQSYEMGLRTKMAINSTTKVIKPVFQKNSNYDADKDDDGVSNAKDNCPFVSNSDNRDVDRDLVGDACDIDPNNKNPFLGDADNDGVDDERDNCPTFKNPKQDDQNADGQGDACMDDDGDGFLGNADNCPTVTNSDQKDVNVDGIGDVCASDKDADGIFDSVDICPFVSNPIQKDEDGDGIGDICDNCSHYNPDQRDENNNNFGDECEDREAYERSHDDDGDGVINWEDNCPKIANPKIPSTNSSGDEQAMVQPDQDMDLIGDACDNCVSIQNQDQQDANNNGIGEMCEDIDGDTIQGYLDNCPLDKNPSQEDKNNDGVGDLCDDTDKDEIRASIDNCPYKYNLDQLDSDHDKIGDICDVTDNRFVESNQTLFITIFTLIGLALLGGIIVLYKKMIKDNQITR